MGKQKTPSNSFVDWVDPFTESRYLQFSKYLGNNLAVLDFGCHRGRGGEVIKTLFPKIKLYGVELSSEAIKLIPSGIYEHVYNLSITELKEQTKFDRIIAGEVIEHIPKKDFVQVLEKCKNLLTDDGLIIFTTPNPDFILVKLGRDTVLKEPSHVNIMTINEFQIEIKKAELRLLEVKGSGRSTRYFGDKIPFLNIYGSYFAVLRK